ncbi:MAG: hypothetical protein NZ739_04660, partial [Verrucomicrobiae bacterium]|nr:hypothetical protein [Verrucomicrobiae bacterium]
GILERLAVLPIYAWDYKSQAPSICHIGGGTAQDFQVAFGVGECATDITGIDSDGVALEAIQGLNEKMEAAKRGGQKHGWRGPKKN